MKKIDFKMNLVKTNLPTFSLTQVERTIFYFCIVINIYRHTVQECSKDVRLYFHKEPDENYF